MQSKWKQNSWLKVLGETKKSWYEGHSSDKEGKYTGRESYSYYYFLPSGHLPIHFMGYGKLE